MAGGAIVVLEQMRASPGEKISEDMAAAMLDIPAAYLSDTPA
jgi:hypothetical protein